MPDLQGKVAIVTGANSGLGLESVKALTRKGATVVMACRSLRKAEEAAAWVREEHADAKLEIMPLDLASLASVESFCSQFAGVYPRLDILLNNAGLMALPLCRTADGFEMQFGTNHLGHFALTMRLMPLIRSTPGARVVQVSSGAHAIGSFDWNDLNWEKKYSKWMAYGRSKLANLLFALELDRRFKSEGLDAQSTAAHPGYATTNLFERGGVHKHNAFERFFISMGGKNVAQSAEMGALPLLFAATAPEAKGGAFYGPEGWLGLKGYPAEVRIAKRFLNQGNWVKLWDASEVLTGSSFS